MAEKAGKSSVVEKTSETTKGNVKDSANASKATRDTQGAAAAYGFGFNIGNFKAEMDEYSILQNHSYLVSFAPFSSISRTATDLNRYIMNDNDTLILRCDQAVLPGIRFMNQDNIRRYGYGPVEVHAHGVQFTDITLTWIVDRNAKIVDFFNKWMKTVVNFESEGGGKMEGNDQRFGSVAYSPYEVGYKDDYSNSLMAIYVYDNTLTKSIEYLLYDVFPIRINDTDVAWGSNDTMLKLSVSFAFTDVKIKTPRAFSDLPAKVQAAAQRSPVVEKEGVALNTATERLPRVITGAPQTRLA